MTIAVSNSRRAGMLSATARDFADKVAEVAGSAFRRHSENKAIAHLLSMNDHQLRDIGLERSGVVAAIRGRANPRTRGHYAGR